MVELAAAFLRVGILIWIYATAWYLVSLYVRRNDVADIAWGLGYCLVCVFLFATEPYSPVSLVLYGLVIAWGLRLSLYIHLRNRKKGEDFRYRKWREAWGNNFYWRSYLQVFVLQACFLLVVVSPIVLSAVVAPQQLTAFTLVGAVCWLVGFVIQSVADAQLSAFIGKRKSKEEIMQTGLWKYSRHPNYFGEVLMWWSIFIIILPLDNSFWFIVSPLTITVLIVFVSGIPMLEDKYRDHAAFEAYKKRTSKLIPWRPRSE